MYTAKVHFTQEAEHDNYVNGVYGGRWVLDTDTLFFSFTDTTDLLRAMAQWMNQMFDITISNAMRYLDNNCDRERFDYSQNENGVGDYTIVTEDNPDVYYVSYSFYIVEVTKKVEYKFEEVRS